MLLAVASLSTHGMGFCTQFRRASSMAVSVQISDCNPGDRHGAMNRYKVPALRTSASQCLAVLKPVFHVALGPHPPGDLGGPSGLSFSFEDVGFRASFGPDPGGNILSMIFYFSFRPHWGYLAPPNI